MLRIFVCSILTGVFLGSWPSKANAQDYLIPAGTLLHCTLEEPNFSSATVTVGDPFVCALRSSISNFGHAVLPRGSYLAGHLEAAKEPGHFVGKGYLRLQFDRVCLSDDCLPVPGKIIAVRGYRVDKKGEVVGHGHAKRDAVEWMIPPLWPWKVVTLPARGPRPTLKGEVPVTLRLMDDLELPRKMAAQAPNKSPWAYRPLEPSTPASSNSASIHRVAPRIGYLPPTAPAMDEQGSVSAVKELPQRDDPSEQHLHLTLIALKSETVLVVESYRIEQGRLEFVAADGLPGALDLDKVDWRKTSRLNANPQAWSTASVQ